VGALIIAVNSSWSHLDVAAVLRLAVFALTLGFLLAVLR
jgi:hypothetical protein